MAINTTKDNSSIVIRRAAQLLTCCVVLSSIMYAHAAPFVIYDGRSAAMGGVGIVANARNAAYHNPALLATNIEDYDAVLLAPTYGQATTDPDKVEQSLDDLQKAALGSDATKIQSKLDLLKDTVYEQDTTRSLALIVPSTIVGTSAFVNSYNYNTVQATIGGDNLSTVPPTYVSTLDHRAVKLTELGASAGTLLDLSDGVFGGMQIGVSAKFLLLQTYGYSEPVNTANLGLNDNQLQRNSMFNFDVGMLREFGVWKLGLVVKNILSKDFKYGRQSDTFSIAPQARLGIAYQSRRTLLEFDTDLTQNKGIGYGEDNAYAAVGWEYQVYSTVFVRAGARQNLAGNKLASGSFGLGLGFWGFELDVAAVSSSQEKAAYANLSYKIGS